MRPEPCSAAEPSSSTETTARAFEPPFSFSLPSIDAFQLAAAVLLTAQLPLTLANSVISTADAAQRYFPREAGRVTPRRLSLSIAAANVWAGFAGGLPVCHGSGGLTAHYSMGARRPRSTAITGVTLIVIALALGNAGLAIRHIVPMPLDVQSAYDIPFVILAGALAVVLDGNLAYAGGVTLLMWYATRAMLHVWPGGMGGLSAITHRVLHPGRMAAAPVSARNANER